MTLTTEKTRWYGLWRTTGTRRDGGEVEALAPTPEAAERVARARAREWVRCTGCGRVNVPPAEAKVSRRAHGCALCAFCRSSSEGPGADFEGDSVGGL